MPGRWIDGLDYIPISHLNALAVCPRRFYYECVLGEMDVNHHVLEGRQRHRIADSGQHERDREEQTLRRVYMYSNRLRIAGLADVVKIEDGDIRPVEYKKGRQGRWLNDHAQLCAQALCLEERLGIVIPAGYLFYFGSQRRVEVTLDEELRTYTEGLIWRAWALAEADMLPTPIQNRRICRECSLEPICLPDEVIALQHGATHAVAEGL
jgi:CRISPR-associated exonuclease Cas4